MPQREGTILTRSAAARWTYVTAEGCCQLLSCLRQELGRENLYDGIFICRYNVFEAVRTVYHGKTLGSSTLIKQTLQTRTRQNGGFDAPKAISRSLK